MSGGIDYSKWDNLDDSGSDEENFDGLVSSLQESTDASRNDSSSLLSGNHSPAEIALLKKGVAYEKEELSDDNSVGWLRVGPTKTIRVHPGDKSTSMYSSIIYTEDPNTYVPDRSDYEDERVQNGVLNLHPLKKRVKAMELSNS